MRRCSKNGLDRIDFITTKIDRVRRKALPVDPKIHVVRSSIQRLACIYQTRHNASRPPACHSCVVAEVGYDEVHISNWRCIIILVFQIIHVIQCLNKIITTVLFIQVSIGDEKFLHISRFIQTKLVHINQVKLRSKSTHTYEKILIESKSIQVGVLWKFQSSVRLQPTTPEKSTITNSSEKKYTKKLKKKRFFFP